MVRDGKWLARRSDIVAEYRSPAPQRMVRRGRHKQAPSVASTADAVAKRCNLAKSAVMSTRMRGDVRSFCHTWQGG